MDKELTLIDSIEQMMESKDQWPEKSLFERRAAIKEFHRRVDEMSLKAPYDADSELIHYYGDNTYGREITVHAGVALVGAIYKEPQINVMVRGKVFVVTENTMGIMEAPCIFQSEAGTQKVGYVMEEMQWITVMSRDNQETDPERIMKDHILEER